MTEPRFVTAEWRRLVMANYEIDPALLKPFVPGGTELDEWEGSCFVSLVGFLFRNVRIKGMRIPFHTEFPEVNLRFYVRCKEQQEWKRGVVFISEIVPKRAVTFIANNVFNEKYSTMPMKYEWQTCESDLITRYEWKKNNRWNKLEVKSSSTSVPLEKDSLEEFITEHYWGYSGNSFRKTNEYHVQHPRWEIYPVQDYWIDADFTELYGPSFSFLKSAKPSSVLLAEGSPVNIYGKRILSLTSR